MHDPKKSGLINLNKPSGMTSRRAVDIVGRLVGKIKIGHAGTLDPLAQGVLVLCLGSATRLIEYVQRMPKRYTGTFLLGRQSPTEDTDGDVVELTNPPVPTLAEIETAAAGLTGLIQQRPPAFSAIKVKGRRAYDLARAGKPPVLKPRPVCVHSLAAVSYDYPRLTLAVECGSGTYIRSLGRDLAESLGTAAVMSSLTRTAIGRFTLDESADPASLSKDSWTSHLLPPASAVQMLPRIDLTAEEMVEIRHGRTIPRRGKVAVGWVERSEPHHYLPAPLVGLTTLGPPYGTDPFSTSEYAAIAPDGRLAAILIPHGQTHLRPSRNFQ